MIDTHSFKLHRQHVEAIATYFFPFWRKQMASKAKDLENTELDDNLILWATWLELMQELDQYFADRVKSSARYEIKITLTMAQVLCLYRAVMHLPLPEKEVFLVLVRSTLLQFLFSYMINLPIQIKPQNRKPVHALEEWDWEL